MGYYSMFQPLSVQEQQEWKSRMGFADYEEIDYDEHSYINEEQGVQLSAPQQTPQQVQQPQPQQTAAPQQQLQTQQPQQQVLMPQQFLNSQAWQAYQQNPNAETLKALLAALSSEVQKETVANQTQQQPQPQPQQTVAPQQQVQTQPQATTPQPQQPNNQQVKESLKNPFLNEEEEIEKKDEKKEEPKDASTADKPKSETSSSNSETRKEDGAKSEIKYDAALNKDEGGNEHDFGWDKMMHDSIFGTSKDPFQDTKGVKYDDVYGAPMDKPKEREMGIEVTKADPFKPEKPSFTSLSDPKAISKTVFTSGSVKIKDAPTVAKEEEAVGTEIKSSEVKSDGKKAENSTEKPSESTSPQNKENHQPKDDKPTEKKTDKTDDGSDETNESFVSDFSKVLNESGIDKKMKEIIIREYINTFGGEFDLGDFSDWIEDKYPNIASNPKLFDEISSELEFGRRAEEFYEEEENEEDIKDDLNDTETEINNEEDVDLDDIVDEYLEQYDGDDYDEEDAAAWLDENFDVDDETKEDFLDKVCDVFLEDDVNESMNDDFFDFEYIKG